MESPDTTVASETPLESSNNTLGSDKLEEEFKFDEKEFSNLTDSNGNLNISEISADEVGLSHRSLDPHIFWLQYYVLRSIISRD